MLSSLFSHHHFLSSCRLKREINVHNHLKGLRENHLKVFFNSF